MWVSQLSGCSPSALTRGWKLCFPCAITRFKKVHNFSVMILRWSLWGTGNPGHSEKDSYQTLHMWSPHFLDPWLDPSMPGAGRLQGQWCCHSSQGRHSIPVPNWEQKQVPADQNHFQNKDMFFLRMTPCFLVKFSNNFLKCLIDTLSSRNFADLLRKKLKSVMFIAFLFLEKTKNIIK